MVNWARIVDEVESVTSLLPEQAEIEAALNMIEAESSEDELFTLEAEEIEQQVITRLLKIIRKNRSKDIKRAKQQKDKDVKDDKESSQPNNVDVQVFGPFGNMGNLKDMGFDIDPKMMENISKGIMDNLFGKKTKKKDHDSDDDPDDDEDRGASFYT
jgi:hypothetical protein